MLSHYVKAPILVVKACKKHVRIIIYAYKSKKYIGYRLTLGCEQRLPIHKNKIAS